MCSVSAVTVFFIHTMEDDQRLNTDKNLLNFNYFISVLAKKLINDIIYELLQKNYYRIE